MKRFLITFFFIAIAFVVLLPLSTIAADQTFTPQVPGPSGGGSITLCSGSGDTLSCNGIAGYITSIYEWLIRLAIVLGVLTLTLAGYFWMTAHGDSKQIDKAKTMVKNTVYGIVLALGSYTLLWAINPDLVQLQGLNLGKIKEVDIILEPGNETSEAVVTNQSKGMECFKQNFGSSEAEVQSKLQSTTLNGFTFRVHQLAAPAFQKVAQELQAAGINYRIVAAGGTGGFNWRSNANNPAQQSLHSFGVAIDINPIPNPNIKPRPGGKCSNPPQCPQECPHDIPEQMIAIFTQNDFRWGGHYRTVCDGMHFEWLGPCKK